MNSLAKTILIIVLSFLLVPYHGFAQQDVKGRVMNDSLASIAREIILSSKTCTLITLDEKGHPRARIMEVLAPDNDFTIWFGTNPKSRKVSQITNDSRVTLLYEDNDRSGYVMLYGTAEIVNNSFEKEKKWKEEWSAFYKDKENDFVLIKVTPDWMEMVSNSRKIFGDPVTWEPQRIWLDASKSK